MAVALAVPTAVILILNLVRPLSSASAAVSSLTLTLRPTLAVFAIGAVIVIVQGLRDYVLNRWLQYPLSGLLVLLVAYCALARVDPAARLDPRAGH